MGWLISMNHWLFKSEPTTFSIIDLQQKHVEPWDGVRNYQARNYLKQCQVGDQAFFYHSSCETPAIVGLMNIVSSPYPDSSAFDPESAYFDPKSHPEQPRWWLVDVEYIQTFEIPLPLSMLKQHSALANLPLVQKGSRLSIMPVTQSEWDYILNLLH